MLNSSIMQILKYTNECVVSKIKCKTGDIVMSLHNVFPGIQLIYNHAVMTESENILIENVRGENILQIDHCCDGRVECSCKDKFFYLSKGDICIHRKDMVENNFYFPSGSYRGISLLIDVNAAPKCLSCFLEDVNVEPKLLLEKFCKGGELFVCRSNSQLEHIFHELYNIPQEVQKGYYKIKVLEILLFLSCLREEMREEKLCSFSQVAMAKEVCRYLTVHMDERITIEDLSRIFHVSQTVLKNSFKMVYGTSVYGFIRRQKMENAASMLKTTDKTVLEIANLHGYENGSKFASAFRDIMGSSPVEYRQNNQLC